MPATLTFPTDAVSGDTYSGYVFDGVKWDPITSTLNELINGSYALTLDSSGHTTTPGNLTVTGTLTVGGSTTYVEGSNTVYTDNVIEIHAPPGGVGGSWTSNDGTDIGLQMHYYNGSDKNAALVLAQDSGELEWYKDATYDTGVFTGTYGRIKAEGLHFSGDDSVQTTAWLGSIDTLFKVNPGAGPGDPFRAGVQADLTNGVTISTITGTAGFATNQTWKFTYDGYLRFPDSSLQSTAYSDTTVKGLFSVSTSSASGGGSLSYSNGVFTFRPASIPTYTVSTASANSTGALSLSGTTFTFTPKADQTTITGNAGSATKLATARNINGVSFDGSANINVDNITNGTNTMKIVAAPSGLTGASGDTPGNVAFDSSYIYYCTTAYVGNTYSGTFTGGSQGNSGAAILTISNNWQPGTALTPANGWTVTFNAGAGNITRTITGYSSWSNSQPNGYWNLTLSSGWTGTVTTGSSFTLNTGASLPNIWTQTPWNAITASGNAATATKLATARAINGTNFDGSADITVTAAAGTLTGTTLNATVVSSSLTSVGTLSSLAVTNSSATPATITYTPATRVGVAILSTGKDTVGGTGYFDFFKATNTTSGATNGSKTLRLNSTGTLEILNSAYSATVFSVTDTGLISINASSSATDGVAVNNGIAMNANSYIFDDGNYHITTKSGNIWLNSNSGGTVNINTQMPSGVTGGGLVSQGAVKSNAAGAAGTAFIAGAGAISGIALQLDSGTAGTAASMAIRDTSTVTSTMYFDVSTGGTPNGIFRWRSSSSFTELMSLSSTQLTINEAVTMGGSTATAYLSVIGSKTYSISGYGYLNSGGAGTVGGNSGNVAYGIYCANRIQSGEVDVTSDERAKDIQGTIPLDRALLFIRAVNGILYTWKPGFGDEGLKSGFSAQGVHKAGFDHMVGHIPNENLSGDVDDDGWTHPDKFQLTMGYNQAIPYHHEVIKHLLDRIEQLESTVAKLSKNG